MECNRYLPPKQLDQFLSQFDSSSKSTLGFSVQNRPIEMLKIGSGSYKILMWSQMHGNESTTTKALIDLIPWLLGAKQKRFLAAFTLYIIPQLNPDGSHLYTRHNANNVDLNRDAINKSQPESRVLRSIYEKIKPNLCLNLHGQRTIYSAGKGGASASISFLAPAADFERNNTAARQKAMQLIAAMVEALSNELPNAIGRYDDTFNPNCVGDSFTQAGTPTILFEAGHVPHDYQREKVRAHMLNAFKALFESLLNPKESIKREDYFKIPKNQIEFCDLIVSHVTILDGGDEIKDQQLAIQYQETLVGERIVFLPIMLAYGSEIELRAHNYVKLSPSFQAIGLRFEEEKLIKNSIFTEEFALKR